MISDLNTEMGKLQAEVSGLHAKFASNNAGLENTKKILEREITVRKKLLLLKCQPFLFILYLQQLGDEKIYLNSKLADMTSKYSAERNRSSDLGSRLDSLERELWFKIKVLTGELEIEREKSLSQTKIDISAVDKKIKGEYASR